MSRYDILDEAARRARRYLDEIQRRRVGPEASAVAALARLDEPLPAAPGDPLATLSLLDEIVGPATAGMAGPRFFGFVIGGVLPVALAANWLADAWDQNATLFSSTPGVAALERVALGWLIELFGLPLETAGAFVTGGTMANFTALAAARHEVLARAGWNVEARGLFGAPPVQVLIGEDAHATLFKALGLLGLGRERVTRVPVDDQGRMRLEALPRLTVPAIVCLQAGNVNSGAVDPLVPLIERAHEAGAWVHVDGAFGLWARASDALRPLVEGLEQADSWAVDAHKWLNVPYDSGVALVSSREALRAAMSISTAYLPGSESERDPSDYTPELSRRARGVEVWAALRTLGRAGIAELVERNCRQARRFASALSAAGHQVLNEVVLNQVLVAFGDAQRTRRVIAALQREGTCWCGVTVWRERTAMRISVCSWATTDEDVERSIEAMLRAAAQER